MKKFRRLIFKFFTGFDLIEYEEIIRNWTDALKLAKEVKELNGKLLKHSGDCIELAQKAARDCEAVIALLKEANVNETLD